MRHAAEYTVIPFAETSGYEVRPASGSLDTLARQGFVGVYSGIRSDGSWLVKIKGEAKDLTRAVFRKM